MNIKRIQKYFFINFPMSFSGLEKSPKLHENWKIENFGDFSRPRP